MNAMILEVLATWTQIASTQMVLSSVSANQDLRAMDCVAKEVDRWPRPYWIISVYNKFEFNTVLHSNAF